MTKLTEDMVIARTRTSDLASIKKFNCWGSDLHDISIIRKFTGVEVLSLSINRISTLSDIQYCQNLVELYIRRNEISDLSELCYLQENPRLKRLLLSENPCVDTVGPLYRATVLRCLPNLENLDGEDVQPEEVDHAMQHGLILQHPLSAKRERISPELEQTYYRESPPGQRNQYEYENESHSQPQQVYRPVSHSPPLEYQYHNGNKTSESVPNLPSDGGATILAPSTNNSNHSNGLTARSTSNVHSSSDSISQNLSPTNLTKAEPVQNNPQLQRRISSSPDYGREQLLINGRRQSADYNYESHNEQQYFDSHPMRSVPQSAREPYLNNNVRNAYGKTRTKVNDKMNFLSNLCLPLMTSNLLSAVLCLIPELDWASLEVVDLAIKRRMDELEAD